MVDKEVNNMNSGYEIYHHLAVETVNFMNFLASYRSATYRNRLFGLKNNYEVV